MFFSGLKHCAPVNTQPNSAEVSGQNLCLVGAWGSQAPRVSRSYRVELLTTNRGPDAPGIECMSDALKRNKFTQTCLQLFSRDQEEDMYAGYL